MAKQHLSRDDRIFLDGKRRGTQECMDMVAMALIDKCGWHVQEETPVVASSDGSFCGACLKIHVHGAVKPFRHTFAKAYVFGRDVTVYQGNRPNTLIIKGTEPEGFYDTPGGAT